MTRGHVHAFLESKKFMLFNFCDVTIMGIQMGVYIGNFVKWDYAHIFLLLIGVLVRTLEEEPCSMAVVIAPTNSTSFYGYAIKELETDYISLNIKPREYSSL